MSRTPARREKRVEQRSCLQHFIHYYGAFLFIIVTTGIIFLQLDVLDGTLTMTEILFRPSVKTSVARLSGTAEMPMRCLPKWRLKWTVRPMTRYAWLTRDPWCRHWCR